MNTFFVGDSSEPAMRDEFDHREIAASKFGWGDGAVLSRNGSKSQGPEERRATRAFQKRSTVH
jgi:hypothetical protein